MAELKPLLDRLIDFGWVVKHGVFYLIRDKVFEFWLRNVHQNKEYLLDVGYEPKISKFNLEIKEYLNKYAEASKQDYVRRLSELFISFDGELVEIDKRSFRFPSFNTVDVRHMTSGGVSYLLLSNNECCWTFLIGLTPLKENDIGDFLNYCKQQKKGVKRKIIISPSEMGANTKLVAKEAKTWIWGVKELNELFDIAGKQRMVLFDLSKAVSREAPAGYVDNLETA